jgi:hypothetical protein
MEPEVLLPCEISGSHDGDYEKKCGFVDRRFRGAYCLDHQGDKTMNWTHAHMNFFTDNDRYCHLSKY